TYDPNTKSGSDTSGKKVKGTIHWVSAQHAINAEARLYERLFLVDDPANDERDFRELINPNSVEILKECKLEPSLQGSKCCEKFQFERLGYFCVDNVNSNENNLVFNRSVTLKDTWAKIEKKTE
ncbi:MAG: glutamine--tRNA ligase, partial [Ignavibacteriales bacterium]|nr:glutamine--tRNA ligase [Ignavibacteriales bacterium]